MKRLTSKINIAGFSFAGVVEVEQESTWENLTDTCTITIPRKLSFEGKDIVSTDSPMLKRGDVVRIELGYDEENELVFEGFIRSVEVKTPLVVHCEDGAFQLKKNPKTVSYKSIQLKELLTDVLPSSIEFEAIDQPLGQFRVQRATAAEILEHLRKEYHIRSFFKSKKLFVGLAYPPSATIKQHYFEFERNIIEDDLEYRSKDQNDIKVKAISILPDNTRLEVEVGKEEGEVRTFNYYNIETEAALRQMAERELDKLSIDGFRGSFTAFGEPYVQHGDSVKLVDNKLDRQGIYLVKKVERNFGVDGFRQKIYLDRKA